MRRRLARHYLHVFGRVSLVARKHENALRQPPALRKLVLWHLSRAIPQNLGQYAPGRKAFAACIALIHGHRASQRYDPVWKLWE
jgi:hypothetical protein